MTTPVLHDDVIRTILSLMNSNELGRVTVICRKWRQWAWQILLKDRLFPDDTIWIRNHLILIRKGLIIRKRKNGMWNMDRRNASEKWGEFLFHMQIFGDFLGFVK